MNGVLHQHQKIAKKTPTIHAWYEISSANDHVDFPTIITYLFNNNIYTGVLFHAAELGTLDPIQKIVPPRVQRVVKVNNELEIEKAIKYFEDEKLSCPVILSDQINLLENFQNKHPDTQVAYYSKISDSDTLNAAISFGKRFDYLVLNFSDPTNIPLELVIASLQKNNTALIKHITDENNIEDAIVSQGVMETGVDGVIFSPKMLPVLDNFISAMKRCSGKTSLALQPCEVTQVKPVGMGYRGCIDLVNLFTPQEGIVVGSTSQGGILCCPEVFELPYMELRPFRVNAGGIHSYVYHQNGLTTYMSELRAGSTVSVVSISGDIRDMPVGRIKIEVRPMRLIEAKFFTSGEVINIIVQDDWHVRVFSDQGLPVNITEINPGAKLLGHLNKPGRHVGIKVDENILEV